MKSLGREGGGEERERGKEEEGGGEKGRKEKGGREVGKWQSQRVKLKPKKIGMSKTV